jgi:putative IMPACT (imprinted ancient) family translation regulator
VRYFGGVKLGAGGLVRAYTDAVASALKDAQRIEYVVQTALTVEIDYPDEARIRRWIAQHGYLLERGSHGAMVALAIRLPAAELAAARLALSNLTQGQARISTQEG